MADAVKTPLRMTAREFVLSMAVTLGGHLLGNSRLYGQGKRSQTSGRHCGSLPLLAVAVNHRASNGPTAHYPFQALPVLRQADAANSRVRDLRVQGMSS